MDARFRFRYVNEFTGTMVLLVLVLLVGAVVLTGRSQRWFAPTYSLQVLLPEQGSSGLGRGSDVFILGIPVGSVQDIRVEETGRLVAWIQIRGDFQRFVRADSTATIKKVFGVAGDAYMEIAKGSGAALPERGALITSRAAEELSGMVEKTLEGLRQEVLGVAAQTRQTLAEWRQLATALRATQDRVRSEDIAPLAARTGQTLEAWTRVGEVWARLGADLSKTQADLSRVVARLDSVATGLEQGRGTVGKLLTDSSLADASQALVTEGRASLETLHEVLRNLQLTTERLPKLAAAATAGASDLPALILQARQSLSELERLVTGLQRHWLVRDYIDLSVPGPRLPPGAVSGDGP